MLRRPLALHRRYGRHASPVRVSPRRSSIHLALATLGLVLALVCFIAPAQAQTTIHIPADQPTIQAGINAASNGDTVFVAPGTYFENIDFKGKAITVTSSAGPAITIIDGGAIGAAVTFKNKETRASILSGFTITHGGGLPVPPPAINAGVYMVQSRPTLLNNVITQNYCQNILAIYSGPLLQGNTISSSLNPEKCDEIQTGGIYLNFDYSDMLVFPQPNPTPAYIVGNIIENNTTGQLGDGGGDGGAGIAVWSGSPIILGNIIRNNFTRSGNGGGINIVYQSGPIAIVQNLIYGNQAGCGGGAVSPLGGSIDQGFRTIIANNTMVNNTRFPGGGGYSNCFATAQIFNGGSATAFVNNIIEGNTSDPLYQCSNPFYPGSPSEYTQPVFDHNLFLNTAGAVLGATCVDVTSKYGNAIGDPRFANAANADYHPISGSPAIDAGNNSVLTLLNNLTGVVVNSDIEGKPREQDATGKGYPIIDIGAYELTGAGTGSSTRVVLTPSAYTGNAGPNYTLTATLSSLAGVPTGQATFYEDGQPVATAVIQAGVATLGNFNLAPGVHSLYASYPGQGIFTPAVSVVIVVDISAYPTTLALTSSANPSPVGQPVTFTVTTSSADSSYIPSPIQLMDSSNNTTLAILTTNSAGIATFTTSALTVGFHQLYAYSFGDSIHGSATAGFFEQIIAGLSTTTAVSSSLNPAPYGQSVTYTATVTSTTSGLPTGTITFSDGATVLGTQPLTSNSTTTATATFTNSTLTVGTHTITATYNPTTGFAGSTATLTQTITGLSTTTALTSSANPANAAISITFTATVTNTSSTSGAPTGNITFSDGATVLATQPLTSSGNTTATAAFSTSTLAVGSHTITATYVATGAFSPGTAALTQVINALASVTTLTATPNPANFGQTVTLVAGVIGAIVTGAAPIPAGTITFYDGATQLASTPLIAGQATITTAALAVGTHTLTAIYSGNAIYSASTSLPFTETIKALPQDFTITVATPTITIQTQHHLTTTVTLTSLNGFTDSLALICANLPTYVTCKPTPNPASLAANGTTTVSLYLDTDSVLGYARLSAPPSRDTPPPSPINLAFLLAPISLLAGMTAFSRHHTRLRLLLLLFVLLPASLVLTGCGELIYPYAVPPSAVPGTYTIPITATGTSTGLTHTPNLTLQITS